MNSRSEMRRLAVVNPNALIQEIETLRQYVATLERELKEEGELQKQLRTALQKILATAEDNRIAAIADDALNPKTIVKS